MALITLNSDIESHYLQYEGDENPVLIEEPIGWKENANQGLKRSSDSDEFITKEARDIKFIKTGRAYILDIERIYGLKSKIRYIVVKENPTDSMDFYKDIYFLDLETFNDENGVLSIKIDEGGLSKTIKAKKSQNFEYDRATTLDGVSIDPVSTRNLLLAGRKIFLQSVLGDENASFTVRDGSKEGGHYYNQTAIPVNIITQSHAEIAQTFSDDFSQVKSTNPNTGTLGLCFFYPADRAKTIILNLDIAFSIIRDTYRGDESDGHVTLNLVIYSGDTTLVLKERITLYELDNPANTSVKKTITYKGVKTLELDEGDSISLELLTDASMGSGFPFYNWGRWNWDISECTSKITITEDSSIDPSNTKVVRVPELLDKWLEIITGQKGLFYSELFGRKDLGYSENGEFSGLTITNGLWIRGFDFKEDKKPSISIEEITTSLNATCAIGTMIEKVGFTEKLRIEPLDFFYIPQITLELPNIVDDLKIYPSVDFIYSQYEFGYEKGGGDYEEATGIGEYNGKAEYANLLNDVDRKLSVVSKIRGDSSMVEFARRKSVVNYSQEDTRYDLDNVFIDAKEGTGTTLIERKWQDDFESAPSGIHDPNSATNLRFSPARMRDRRSLFLASSLFQYPDSYIRFTSSNCNSNLISKIAGKEAVQENGYVQVKSYGRPQFKMYWAEFTHIVDFDTSKKLRSKITIEGKERYVFYGIIKFRVSEDDYKHGYLFEVKENGKGQWKVLLANR